MTTFKQLKQLIKDNRADKNKYYDLEALLNDALTNRKITCNQWTYLIEFLNCNF